MASVLCRLAAKTKLKKVFVEDEIFSRNYYPLLIQKSWTSVVVNESITQKAFIKHMLYV